MHHALNDTSRPLPHIPMLEVIAETEEALPEGPTELAHKLTVGEFVVSVEMSPPRSYTPQSLLTAAQLLQDAGADVINVADSPTARMRMSPWAHLSSATFTAWDGDGTAFPDPRGVNLLARAGRFAGRRIRWGLRKPVLWSWATQRTSAIIPTQWTITMWPRRL